MSTSTTTLQAIIESLTAFKPMKPELIRPECTLAGDLELDSQEELELVFNLEDKCQVKLPPAEFAKCETVQDLIDFIERVQAA